MENILLKHLNPTNDLPVLQTIDDLPTIIVTGIISHWQPIDGPSYAIIPNENLDVPTDDGKIYLYGNDILHPNLDGKEVTITGQIVENYAEFQASKHGAYLGGDPSTSAIFVTEIQQ